VRWRFAPLWSPAQFLGQWQVVGRDGLLGTSCFGNQAAPRRPMDIRGLKNQANGIHKNQANDYLVEAIQSVDEGGKSQETCHWPQNWATTQPRFFVKTVCSH
jgi:hypothetical protein